MTIHHYLNLIDVICGHLRHLQKFTLMLRSTLVFERIVKQCDSMVTLVTMQLALLCITPGNPEISTIICSCVVHNPYTASIKEIRFNFPYMEIKCEWDLDDGPRTRCKFHAPSVAHKLLV